MRTHPATWGALVLLLVAVVGLQMLQAAQPLATPGAISTNLLYVQSPRFIRRATLSFQALAADVYWIRAVQHYGGTKLSHQPNKQYDVLYPLIDLTTSLDPYFDVVYKFGSVFLAEPYPAGAGRPDQAIALLQKGLRTTPDKWQLAQGVGFIYYWWLADYPNAAKWFNHAADMPGAPDWLRPLAAVTLAQGGNRASSRVLWTDIAGTADADWLRDRQSSVCSSSMRSTESILSSGSFSNIVNRPAPGPARGVTCCAQDCCAASPLTLPAFLFSSMRRRVR